MKPYDTVTAHIGQANIPTDARKRILDGRLWMFLHAGDMLSALQRIAMGADNPREEAQYIVRLLEDVDSYDPSRPQDRPPKVRNQ